MNRILLFIGLFLSFSAGPVWADMSPMAEKHIFTPDNAGEQKEEVPPKSGIVSPALEKEILFTGVLITPKGKSVILAENVKSDKAGLKHVLKQGDQIKGMTIQEIGSNFVLLSGKENTTVKMNLYKGAKARPAPVLAEAAAGANTPKAPPVEPKTENTPEAQPQGTPAAEKAGPFGGGNNRGKTQPQQSGEPPANPFMDGINKATLNRSPAAIPAGIPANPFNQSQ